MYDNHEGSGKVAQGVFLPPLMHHRRGWSVLRPKSPTELPHSQEDLPCLT